VFTTLKRYLSVFLLGALSAGLAPAQPLTLAQALQLAKENDPWIDRSEQLETALRERSIAAGSLPDPVVSVGLANLPVDSFDFNQEPMTQAVVGVSQTLPRGAELDWRRRKLEMLGDQQPLQREDRRARVVRDVTRAWLDAWRAHEAVALIERDGALFDYLVELTRSRYASALGRTRQQDLVRAQLERTRLDDRLQELRSREEAARASLAAWLVDPGTASTDARSAAGLPEIAESAPHIALQVPALTQLSVSDVDALLAARLPRHPAVAALDRQIAASRADVSIAEQAYQPQWRLNASYGYRDDAPAGIDRDDFFSVGVAFDLPLFASNRQDPLLRSALASSEAMRTERALLLRELRAEVHGSVAQLKRLGKRTSLYADTLLRQMREQAEASLAAYTADEADFDEVVRARIDELNARIDALDIRAARLRVIADLNYLLTESAAGAGDTR
jgi:outer membrane protein TolC